MVPGAVWRSHRAADSGLAGDPHRRRRPDFRAYGSGKTLAAFLICLDQLVREARTGELPDETRVVYVSPLKALSNDVRKNLEIPLAQIRELAEKRGVTLAPIRTAVRTGDTPHV